MQSMMLYGDSNDFAIDYCKEVINRLKQVMEQKDISQGALAMQSGLAQSTISKFFSGDTRVSLIHIAKICHALEIDPGEVLSLDNGQNILKMPTETNDFDASITLINNPEHPAFKGYLRPFKVYFNSTISSENKILQGDLEFYKSENGKSCISKLKLDTGKKSADGSPVYKHYVGKLIISLSMSCCYCILVAKDIGEICFLVFDHMFLFNEELACRLACVSTVSSGGNKRPTMHRLLISRVSLSVNDPQSEDFKFVRGQLMLNTSDIFITKDSYEKLKASETELLSYDEMQELIDEFEQNRSLEEIYHIDEAKLRNADCQMENKVKFISLLREYSMSCKYNKISTKADEHVYNYLENKI